MWGKHIEQLAQDTIALHYVTPWLSVFPYTLEALFDQYYKENNIRPKIKTDDYAPHTASKPEEWDELLMEVIKNTEHPLRGVLLLAIVWQLQWQISKRNLKTDDVKTLVLPWVRAILHYTRIEKRNNRKESRYAKA